VPDILTIKSNVTRRSVLSLLFVLLFVLMPWLTVSASSVGASGTFGGTNYTVQTGSSLIDTGTDFIFINNFSTPVTVEFLYEAPLGVSIDVPSEPVVVAGGSSYRIMISITTTASTPVGTFPLRLVGIVIPDSTTGVEITGSAGLNASITVAGIPPTTAPELTLLEVTSTSFRVRIRNIDFDPIIALYELGNPLPTQGPIDLEPNAFIIVTFSDLDPNTIYTLFASGRATGRIESFSSLDITTLIEPVTPPGEDPGHNVVPPPAVPAPPPSSGGGGALVVNVLVIDLEFQSKNLNVFETYQPPQMSAYVSVRSNNREISRIDVTDRVVITGSVDTTVLGRYEVRYFLRYNTLTIQEVVVVQVRDLEAPQIFSPAEITIKVDDPFVYQLIATDNYNRPEDLIITGFPSFVDTSKAGVQRYSVVVADQSGNRTPFLFTVIIRERVITSITLTVNGIELTLEEVDGLFNVDNYRVEVAIAVNQPLPNSPSWTRFTGQQLEASRGELVYVRLTDDQGNVLLGVIDVITGRVLPLLPDDNLITGDPWWRVLLRSSNLLLWIIPGLLLLAGWGWFFFFLAKRRKKKEEDELPLDVTTPVIKKQRKASTGIPSIKDEVQLPPETKSKDDTLALPKTRVKKEDLDAPLEPLIQEPRLVSPLVNETPPAKATDKPVKAKRKPRKPKQEVYAQLVALEQEGVMDDDLLGLEVIPQTKKPMKDVLSEESPSDRTTSSIDEKQIDMFTEIGDTPPKPKRKKKDS